MTMFEEQTTTLKILGKSEYDLTVSNLTSNMTKAMLMGMVQELTKVVPGPYRIVSGDKEVPDPEYYIARKKAYAFRTEEAARFVALFFHHPDNMSLYWSGVPEIYKELIFLLIRQGYVSVAEAKNSGFDSILTIVKSRYSFEDDTVQISGHEVWFTFEHSGHYWNSVTYIGLRQAFALTAARSLGVTFGALFKELPENWKVVNAEAEAISSVPLITATLKQGTLKFSKARVTAASSWKFMKSMPIPEILPDYSSSGEKLNCGQSFLPLFNGIPEKTLNKAPVQVLKAAADRLFKLNEELLIPMLMSHIKGFKANELYHCILNSRRALKEYFSESEPGDWVVLDFVTLWLSINSLTLLNKRMIRNMDLEDPIYGGPVTLDRIVTFDRSILGSFCTALYGLGMVEVALAPLQGYCYDPYMHVSAVRLTALGRYAFGLSESYEAPAVKNSNLFELDDQRLVIRSLSPGNPYESLLTDTSASIGNGRFLMTPESFLKNCKTKRDVADKVEFFHQYICAEPPGVWTDFFKTVEQRCNPLKTTKESYSVYLVDAADTYLISLLTTDTVLKGIVIRAEGYRILIPSSKRSTFVSRLKSFGYLL